MYNHPEIMQFYKRIIEELNFKNITMHNLQYLYNQNTRFKIYYEETYDNKQMILADENDLCMLDKDKLSKIIFHPLDENGGLCSLLAMEDSIHMVSSIYIYSIFKNVLKIKLGLDTHSHNHFDNKYIKKLPRCDKNTIRKWHNLYSIISATFFSRNLIRFSIDLTNQPQSAQVNFIYPLHDYLNAMQNNTIFGIQLNNSEIELFKQIYQYFIIDIIDELFAKSLDIPKNSNKFPKFYILMKTYIKIKELVGHKYKMGRRVKNSLIIDEINNLNKYSCKESAFNDLEMSKEIQKLDQESYQNELQMRKESSPDWLLLKDDIVQENLNNKQMKVIIDNKKDSAIEVFEKHLEANNRRYIKRINSFLVNESVNDYEQNYQKMKKNEEWSEIILWQNLVLNILKENGGSLWFDTRIDQYRFRSKVGGDVVTKNQNEISELLTRTLKESITNYLNHYNSNFLSTYAIEIVLVSKLNGINNQKLKINEKANNVIKILIFENEIRTIDDDRFDIESSLEFIKDGNALSYTRNRFIPTKYLEKRFDHRFPSNNNLSNYPDLFTKNEKSYLFEKNEHNLKQTINCEQLSFIEQFIFYLVNEDCHIYYYVMNWLAVFFNSLQKSGTALVLLGDQEVTQNIFWDKIIKEIFGLQYCITINDEECNTATSFDIVTDKLFFHIGDIINPATQFDDTTLFKIVKEFLAQPSVSRINENNEKEETIIHGQMIITSKNPFPYIKRAMSKCTIIKVNDMDTIIEKLEIPDELILEDKIQKNLDNFANSLRFFEVNYHFVEYAMDTEDRETVKNNKSPNIDKEDINNKIDDFIQAIKAKDIDYFEKVKDIDDGTIYKHLKNAFDKDEGYFINQYLFDCYNSIHANQPFANKKQLHDKLKEKDDMFNQEVKILKILDKDKKEKVVFPSCKTSKETGYKELYKIKDYKLAKNLLIPNGATLLSSQTNISRYDFEDKEEMDNCIKRTKEYRVKKANEKK